MKLFWDDVNNNKYFLGELYRKDNKYFFYTNPEGINEAMMHGCFGIGTIDIEKKINESNELFDFFKCRLPDPKNPNIKNILKSIGLENYNEYEILKKTQGRLLTDRYYIEM